MWKLLLILAILCNGIPAYAGFQQPNQDQPYYYFFASGATVNRVKSGYGVLHSITVEGGTTSPIDIYDSISGTGTLIASFTTTNTLQTYPLDVQFTSGCTVVTNNNSLKYTVSYR